MEQNSINAGKQNLLKPWQIALIVIAILVVIGVIIAICVSLGKKSDTGGGGESSSKFLTFIKSNVVRVDDALVIPKSYYVVPGYFEKKPNSTDEALKNATAEDRYKRCSEQHYQTHGTNIYDASLWTIVWCLQKDDDAVVSAEILPWIKHLSTGGNYDGKLVDTKGGNTTWNYNGAEQTDTMFYNLREASQVKYEYPVQDRFCQILNTTLGGAGDKVHPENDKDVQISGDIYSGCKSSETTSPIVNSLYYTWSDWRPVSGENAWAGLIGNSHILNRFALNSEIALTAKSMARRVFSAVKTLQFNSGGIYYSPQSTADDSTPEKLGWNDTQYSVENMASLCAGLYMYATVSGLDTPESTEAMDVARKAASFVVDACTVREGTYTYKYSKNNVLTDVIVAAPTMISGGLCAVGSDNTTPNHEFAIDTFSWTISVFGTQLENKKAGTCFGLWQTAKKHGGYYEDGQLRGVGYSINFDNVISGEWTLGAIGACRVMHDDLYKDDAEKRKSLAADISDMRKGVESLVTTTDVPGKDMAAVYYAQKYYIIPFGWNAERNASLASTAWQYLDQTNFNPFRLDGAFKSAMPDL